MRSRLSQVRTSLQDIGDILHGVEAELETGMRILEDRQQQLETYEQAASLTPEQRDAIEQMVASQFKAEGKRSARRDVALCVLGLLVAVLMGFAVEWLAEPVWNVVTR